MEVSRPAQRAGPGAESKRDKTLEPETEEVQVKLKRYSWLILLIVFALAAAACGGDGDEETTTTAGGGEETTTTAGPEETTTSEAMAEVATDIGVDPETHTITLGLLADLTGIFSPLVIDIVDAQQVYWDDVVNAAGGVGGEWQVEVLVEDTNYNVEQHGEKYETLRDQVVAFTQSTGSPTTVSILDKIKEDNVLVIPLSWYSGWAIPEFDGGLVLEQGTNYCIEAMNILGFINEMGGTKLALATFPGDYGQDAAAGVKIAADYYGIEIVYDGEGAVIPGQDQTPVIQAIAGSGADWTFLTTNPSTGAEIMGGAAQAGYAGAWTGSVPTYDFRLLDTPLAPLLSAAYYQSGYSVTWGTDIPGMQPMYDAMIAAKPDARPSDAFLIGWNEAKSMHQILELALQNGDLTRQGVIDAAQSIPVIDLEGTAPNQTYAGTPNEYVVRQSVMLKPNSELYTAAGGAEQTIGQEGGGTTGSEVAKDFFASEAAMDFEFSAPCYALQ